jgi:hypothetical protein
LSELWVWNRTSCIGSEFCGSVFDATSSASFTIWNGTLAFNWTWWDGTDIYDAIGPSVIGEWSNQSNPADQGGINYDFDLCAEPFAKMGYTGLAYHARDATSAFIKNGTQFSWNQSAIAILTTDNPSIGLLGLNTPRTCRMMAAKALGPTFFSEMVSEANKRGLSSVWSYTAGNYNREFIVNLLVGY